jgi:hypothetical protein
MDDAHISQHQDTCNKSSQHWVKILEILRELGREVLAEEDHAHNSVHNGGDELNKTSAAQ